MFLLTESCFSKSLHRRRGYDDFRFQIDRRLHTNMTPVFNFKKKQVFINGLVPCLVQRARKLGGLNILVCRIESGSSSTFSAFLRAS